MLILPWLDAVVPPPGPLLGQGGEVQTFPASTGGRWTGIILYPIIVLALIILYRNHLHIAAEAWAIMALGDGMAGVIGLRCSGGVSAPGQWRGKLAATLPWNRQKTWAGSISFALAGTVGAYLLMLWVAPAVPPDKALAVCIAAALIGAVVESLPIALDDNLTVPMVVGAFMFCALLVERSALDSNLPYLGRRIVLAIAANLVFALLARALGAASRSGAICGFVLGTAIYLGYGYKSFILLFVFVLFGSAATRFGFRRKAARGVAEPLRRGARLAGGTSQLIGAGVSCDSGDYYPPRGRLPDCARGSACGGLGRHRFERNWPMDFGPSLPDYDPQAGSGRRKRRHFPGWDCCGIRSLSLHRGIGSGIARVRALPVRRTLHCAGRGLGRESVR